MTRPGITGFAPALLALAISACTTGSRLSTTETGDLARITDYLNGIPRFEARFVQTGDFGPGAGLIWLDRPGHLRIDYEGAGAQLMVIADGRVRVLDRRTGALTTMAVSRTPLGLLLAPTITLSGDAHVDSLTHTPGQTRLVLTKTGLPGQGSLTLDFADRPLHLEAVTVINPRRQVLTMQLSGIEPNPAITPSLFQPPAAMPGS